MAFKKKKFAKGPNKWNDCGNRGKNPFVRSKRYDREKASVFVHPQNLKKKNPH